MHELYFVGYAFLNYLSTPFLFAEPGFEVAEGNPYFGAGEKWPRLHVTYPAAYPTHSREQTLYFNEKGLLKRLDYVVEPVHGGASHFCLEYKTVGGSGAVAAGNYQQRRPVSRLGRRSESINRRSFCRSSN